ncbi:ankyrin-3-like isoform X2 [Gigantopelta aegis]|uniref:ankyrin-3-like isoform X2 n=1 Tax=Gigantopelta aegis TaxID=1735272 RepID=UPI001B88CA76|nr:ankyrin-3-like isoform X2 [Gigantopelta aegis]
MDPRDFEHFDDMDDSAEDAPKVHISASAELRNVYVEMYKAVIRGNKDLLKTHQQHLNSPIVIEYFSGCSCVRKFEEHPHQEDDTQGDRLTQVLDLIKQGKCPCLTDKEHPVSEQGTKYLSHAAASVGDLDMLKFLVELGCAMSRQTTICGYTPLFIAVKRNHVSLVRYLLTLDDIDVNCPSKGDKHTPLMEALQDKKSTIVDLLINVPNIDVNMPNFLYETPLIIAAKMEHVEFVIQLLKAGANPNAKDIEGMTALMHVVRFGFADIAKILLSSGASVDVTDTQNETALQFAVCRGDVDLVTILLNAGANPNHIPDDGHLALVLAANNNSWEIINLLLESGANISITNNHKYSALHMAAWNGSVESAKVLLEHSASHDTKTTEKNTPLSLAAQQRHPEMIKLLLPYGCDVNNSNNDLTTPLHDASLNGDVESVELLLRHGADPDVKNKTGATPLWLAVYFRKTAPVKLLLQKNANMYIPSFLTDTDYQTGRVEIVSDTLRTPLWVAAANGAPEMAMLLISAGYNVSKENWILDDMPEAASENETFASLLRYHKCRPPSLLSICRNVFRQYFGKQVAEKSQALDVLPITLKHYIMLKDILNCDYTL